MASYVCLKCNKKGEEKLYTHKGCNNICYICSKCYNDTTATDEELMTYIAKACKLCLPAMMSGMKTRSCVYCKRYSNRGEIVCNCVQPHYICSACNKSCSVAAKKALDDVHSNKVTSLFDSPAALEVGKKIPVRRTRPDEQKHANAKTPPRSVLRVAHPQPKPVKIKQEL